MIWYNQDHVWMRQHGNAMVLGISVFAARALGDIVHLELPEIGATLDPEFEFALIESNKIAVDVFAPVPGQVLDRNQAALAQPSMVSRDPEGGGWLVAVAPSAQPTSAGLMDAQAYATFCSGGG